MKIWWKWEIQMQMELRVDPSLKQVSITTNNEEHSKTTILAFLIIRTTKSLHINLITMTPTRQQAIKGSKKINKELKLVSLLARIKGTFKRERTKENLLSKLLNWAVDMKGIKKMV